MKRQKEIDILKALAAFMVILIHVTATPVTVLASGTVQEILMLVNRFSKPSVPIFFFVSGLMLQRSTQNRTFQYGRFLGRRAARVLIPYVFWCIVYYAWFLASGTYSPDLRFFCWNLFSGKLMYHLYFIPAILQFYLLFGVFRGIVMRYSKRWVLPVVFCLNVLEILWIPQLYYGRCFATYLTVFTAGCYAGDSFERFRAWASRRSVTLFSGSLTVLLGFVYTLQFSQQLRQEPVIFANDRLIFLLFSLAMSIFGCGLVIALADSSDGRSRFSKKITEGLAQTGQASYSIYLAHPLFLLIGGKIAAFAGLGVVREMIVSLLLTLLVCIPASIGWEKFRVRMRKKHLAA